MKCFEVKDHILSEYDRLYAHGVNIREFGSCPVCEDLEAPLPQTRKVIRETFNPHNGGKNDKKWWKFW